MSSKLRLRGKVGIVTGGANGIGAETVKLFVENGASVVIADIDDEGNAGVAGNLSTILDFDLNKFDNTMAVNARGVAATIKHVARVMVARKTRGSIICTASVAGSYAGSTGLDYTVSKHGLIGLVRAACFDLGAYGIRVNCISPYAVATGLTCGMLNMDADEVEAIGRANANLQGITLKTNHIAEVVLFLASDESAYVSGLNLVVDGGFSVVQRCLLEGKP